MKTKNLASSQPMHVTGPVLPKSNRVNKVRLKIRKMVEKDEIPSIAIAVAKEGQIMWEEAFGYGDLDRRIASSPLTIYPVASISKSLTATGVMVLVERRQLNLDDPVEKHIAPVKLTAYEGQASEVTVRRVLNMTAGIPHGYEVCEGESLRPALQDFVNRYGITVFSPGEVELYSNFSYAILELLIENLSDSSFADFMRREIFEPLGMMHTSVGAPFGTVKHVATKYGSAHSSIPHNYFVPAAAGGIYSSIHDLIRYGSFHLGNRLPNQNQILEEETLTAMHAGNLQSPTMALGWGLADLGDELVWVISNGSIEGATSMLSLVPSVGLAVACLTNITSPSSIADQIAIDITDALLPKFADKVAAFMQRYERANTFEAYHPSKQFIGAWEGEIKTHEAGIPIRIVFHTEGKISAQLDKRKGTPLSNVCIRDGELKGDFNGELPNEKNFHGEHPISIHVKARNHKMSGVATAKFSANQRFALLPYYICLHRT